MIWIDFDNAPHVPLLVPIVRELQRRGIEVFCTARDFTQTVPMLQQSGLPFHKVGNGAGRSRLGKLTSLGWRLAKLLWLVRRKNIVLAINHGSRTQTACARLLGIPILVLLDYEYTELSLFRKYADLFYTPRYIPRQKLVMLGFDPDRIDHYDGLKEHIYLQDFQPEADFRRRHNLPENKILVTVRTPATCGNYHDARSELLFDAAIRRLVHDERCYLVLLPRNAYEKRALLALLAQEEARDNWIIPQAPLPGLQLIWHSDIVISGGGTMNREGAALGVPTYSIFTAQKGAVDEYLERHGKLTFLRSVDDVRRLPIRKREISTYFQFSRPSVRDEIVHTILVMAQENGLRIERHVDTSESLELAL